MMRCRGLGGFLSIVPIPVLSVVAALSISVGALHRNHRCLNSSTVGIQNADALGELTSAPVYAENIETILEGALRLCGPAIHQ